MRTQYDIYNDEKTLLIFVIYARLICIIQKLSNASIQLPYI